MKKYNCIRGCGNLTAIKNRRCQSCASKEKPISLIAIESMRKVNKDKPLSIEHRIKISEANTGKKLSIEHCIAIGKSKEGIKLSNDHKKKLSNALIGKSHIEIYGIEEAEQRKLKMIEIGKANKGKTVEELGHKLYCGCMFCKAKRGETFGENNNAYKGGRTPLHTAIRNIEKTIEWRLSIFKRDNYTCQDCSQIGGDIQAHHKKPFSILLDEFLNLYNRFSPIEDKETLLKLAMDYEPFWDVSNGETLCKECHGLHKKELYKRT